MKVSVSTALGAVGELSTPVDDEGESARKQIKVSTFAFNFANELDEATNAAKITQKNVKELSALLMKNYQEKKSLITQKHDKRIEGLAGSSTSRDVAKTKTGPEYTCSEKIETARASETIGPKKALLPKKSAIEAENAKHSPMYTGRRVKFGNVEVYKFGWAQGCDTIPSCGAISLGMEDRHHLKHTFKLDEFAKYQQMENQVKMANWRTIISKKSNSSLSVPKKSKSTMEKRRMGSRSRKFADKAIEQSMSSSDDSGVEPEDDEFHYFNQFHMLEPLRRLILTSNKLPIEESVANETREIVESRSQCGCKCSGGRCVPDTCRCSAEGIKCQVDLIDEEDFSKSMPCSCTAEGCSNPEGRIELDPVRIRNHFLQTMMRLKAAKRKGLDQGTRTHSPQHTIFPDEDAQGPSNMSPRSAKCTKSPTAIRTRLSRATPPPLPCSTKNHGEIPVEPFVTVRKRKKANSVSPAAPQGEEEPSDSSKPVQPLFPTSMSLLSFNPIDVNASQQEKRRKRKN